MASLEAQIRKNRKNLVIGGQGVILFGLWQSIKLWIILLGRGELKQIVSENVEDSGFNQELFKILFICILMILMAIVMAIHWYIGKNAMNVGRGHKRKFLFLILVAIYAAMNLSGLPYYFTANENDISDSSVAAFLVDLTLTVTLIEIIISYVRVIYLEKKVEQK